MAQPVVNRLEMIEISHDDGNRAGFAAGALQLLARISNMARDSTVCEGSRVACRRRISRLGSVLPEGRDPPPGAEAHAQLVAVHWFSQ